MSHENRGEVEKKAANNTALRYSPSVSKLLDTSSSRMGRPRTDYNMMSDGANAHLSVK